MSPSWEEVRFIVSAHPFGNEFTSREMLLSETINAVHNSSSVLASAPGDSVGF